MRQAQKKGNELWPFRGNPSAEGILPPGLAVAEDIIFIGAG